MWFIYEIMYRCVYISSKFYHIIAYTTQKKGSTTRKYKFRSYQSNSIHKFLSLTKLRGKRWESIQCNRNNKKIKPA